MDRQAGQVGTYDGPFFVQQGRVREQLEGCAQLTTLKRFGTVHMDNINGDWWHVSGDMGRYSRSPSHLLSCAAPLALLLKRLETGLISSFIQARRDTVVAAMGAGDARSHSLSLGLDLQSHEHMPLWVCSYGGERR
jgi:hypothetical protein